MFITLDTALPIITLLVVAYQAYKLHELDKDLDDIIDKHNDFVESVATVFDAIIEKTQEE
jgi:hypothetical protein